MLSYLEKRKQSQYQATLMWKRLWLADGSASRGALLALGEQVGRMMLYYTYAEEQSIGRLWLGLPAEQGETFRRWERLFASTVKSQTAVTPPSLTPQPLYPTDCLPFGKESWTAQMVNGRLFISIPPHDNQQKGSYFPTDNDTEASPWQVGDPLPFGVTAQLPSQLFCTPSELVVTEPSADRWLLGRTDAGQVVASQTHLCNIYGGAGVVEEWLATAVTHTLHTNQPLIVLDGTNRLLHALRRRGSIAQRIQRRAIHINEADGLSVWGYPILQPLPAEDEERLWQRWRNWFGSMLPLTHIEADLRHLFEQKLFSLPAIRRQMLREGANPLLRNVIDRLLAPEEVGRWLRQPRPDHWQTETPLLIALPTADSWHREQFMKMYLLMALNSGARVVTHQVKWVADWRKQIQAPTLVSNGVRLPDATLLLTASRDPRWSAFIQEAFLPTPEWQECYPLLGEQTMVQTGAGYALVSWRKADDGT